MEQPVPASTQKLPAGLAGVLNSPDMNRDSAYYSSTDPSSKHTSAASCIGLSVTGPPSASSIISPNAYRSPSSQPDKTPSPTSAGNHLPQPLVSPSTSSMSVASMVSPTTAGPNDLRRLADRPLSYELAPNSATLSVGEYDHMARRESVDSRINQGFGDLRLGGNSPYASHNHSTTSVHTAQQRQPRTGLEGLSVHRISNGYQPSAERTPDGHSKAVRTAPAITGPATSQIARAAEPTKGQAWAFPEEEIQRMPSTTGHPQSLIDSRRSSIADSLASSQFTTESRLPSAQHRFEEHSPGSTGTAGALDYHDHQRLSGEYPTTHHHALQHRRLEDLQAESEGAPPGSQPYSRTPELRISHKLAERKRRTEMKELFEQLRDLMPQERGSKASKWEILTKAITEHQRLQDTVRSVQQHSAAMSSDMSLMKNELHMVRMENQQLRAELNSIHQSNGVNQGQPSSSMHDPFSRGSQAHRPGPELPPLRALSSTLSPTAPPPPPQPESMTGVQYEQTRVNGFRPPDRY